MRSFDEKFYENTLILGFPSFYMAWSISMNPKVCSEQFNDTNVAVMHLALIWGREDMSYYYIIVDCLQWSFFALLFFH